LEEEMRITPNFDLFEFASKDGAAFPLDVLRNIGTTAQHLQKIRDKVGRPITINSGYRSPAHNRAVGGATNSTHLRGIAADIVVSGRSPNQMFTLIKSMMDSGEIPAGGLKAYQTFLHVDFRGSFVTW
jgi:uncharacterized protein YcbK (DUF882 family)